MRSASLVTSVSPPTSAANLTSILAAAGVASRGEAAETAAYLADGKPFEARTAALGGPLLAIGRGGGGVVGGGGD